jgi:hypothetical protein
MAIHGLGFNHQEGIENASFEADLDTFLTPKPLFRGATRHGFEPCFGVAYKMEELPLMRGKNRHLIKSSFMQGVAIL